MNHRSACDWFAGIFFILPCIENYAKVDLRTLTFDVPPQEILTKDSVTVSVDAVVYYRVSNATVSIANVENAHHSTRLLAQTTLRYVFITSRCSTNKFNCSIYAIIDTHWQEHVGNTQFAWNFIRSWNHFGIHAKFAGRSHRKLGH